MNFLRVALVSLLCLANAAAQAQTAKAVDMTAEPDHHLFLQNEYTRVFKVEVPAHQPTLLHRHDRDYVFVSLGAADLENDVEGKSPVSLHLQDGEVHFAPGNFSHVAVNRGDTPFRNVTIEILKAAKAPAGKPAERGLEVGHGGMTDIVVDNDEVQVTDTQVAAGGMLPAQRHKGPYLIVAVSNLALHRVGEKQPKAPAMLEMKRGDVRWFAAGTTAEMMNMGKQNQRFIAVEFK